MVRQNMWASWCQETKASNFASYRLSNTKGSPCIKVIVSRDRETNQKEVSSKVLDIQSLKDCSKSLWCLEGCGHMVLSSSFKYELHSFLPSTVISQEIAPPTHSHESTYYLHFPPLIPCSIPREFNIASESDLNPSFPCPSCAPGWGTYISCTSSSLIVKWG